MAGEGVLDHLIQGLDLVAGNQGAKGFKAGVGNQNSEFRYRPHHRLEFLPRYKMEDFLHGCRVQRCIAWAYGALPVLADKEGIENALAVRVNLVVGDLEFLQALEADVGAPDIAHGRKIHRLLLQAQEGVEGVLQLHAHLEVVVNSRGAVDVVHAVGQNMLGAQLVHLQLDSIDRCYLSVSLLIVVKNLL